MSTLLRFLVEWKDAFESLAYVATILGIPLAILIFWNEKRRERIEREYGTYDASNGKYIEYLRLCLENPDLNVFDVPLAESKEENPNEVRKTLIIFTILIAIMERAFLMYRDQSTKVKQAQWTGWTEYMEMWASRQHFRKAWRILGPQFDRDFVAYMNEVVGRMDASVGSKGAATPPAA